MDVGLPTTNIDFVKARASQYNAVETETQARAKSRDENANCKLINSGKNIMPM